MSNWFVTLFQRLIPGRHAGSSKPAMAGEIDQEMREVFLAELSDIVQNTAKSLAAWQADYANPAHSRALSRAFHTLKGSAPIVGATPLAELGQAAEQTTKSAGRKRNPDLAQIQAIEAAVTLLPQWLEAISNNLPAPETTRSVTAALRRTQG